MKAGTGNNKNLRQKIIAVLYLIFLSFIFLYISSDFLDGLHKTNNLLDECLQVAHDSTMAEIEQRFDSLGPDIQTEHKSKMLPLDNQLHICLALIHQIEDQLTKNDRLTDLGYYASGRSSKKVNDLFKGTLLFDSLLLEATVYGTLLQKYLPEGGWDKNLPFIYQDALAVSSKGKPQDMKTLFFKKIPLNVALTHLKGLHLALLARHQKASFLFKLQALKKENLLNLLKQGKSVPENEKLFFLTKPEGRYSCLINEEIPFSLHFDAQHFKEAVRMEIRSEEDQLIHTTTYKTPGQYHTKIGTTGRYKIVFSTKEHTDFFEVEVRTPEKYVYHDGISYLFLGSDNRIVFSEAIKKNLGSVNLSQGSSFIQGNVLTIRPEYAGFLTITFLGKSGESLYVKKYYVFQLPIVKLLLAGVPSGSSISSHVARGCKSLEMENTGNIFFSDQLFTITSFKVMRLNSQTGRYGKEIENSGSLFNPDLRSVMQSVQPGDRIMFFDIKLKSIRGYSTTGETYIIDIK